MREPAILNCFYALAHAPDLVRYGSKPVRELDRDPSLLATMTEGLRPWDQVVGYPPNQVFIGNLRPDDLASIPRPWYRNLVERAAVAGPFGRMITEAALYGLMKLCDDFDRWPSTRSLRSEQGRTSLSSITGGTALSASTHLN